MAEEKFVTTFINQSESIIWQLPQGINSEAGAFRLPPRQTYQFENRDAEDIYSPYEKIILKDVRGEPERPEIKIHPRKSWKPPDDAGWVLELQNKGKISPNKFVLLTDFLASAPFGISVFIYRIPARNWEAEFEKIIFKEPEKHHVPEYGSGRLILTEKPSSSSLYIRRSPEQIEILHKQRRRSAEIFMKDFIEGAKK